MKIYQLLDSVQMVVTNEEQAFINKHNNVRITALDEHDTWIAQNLVRKGVYKISKDNNTLVRQVNEIKK